MGLRVAGLERPRSPRQQGMAPRSRWPPASEATWRRRSGGHSSGLSRLPATHRFASAPAVSKRQLDDGTSSRRRRSASRRRSRSRRWSRRTPGVPCRCIPSACRRTARRRRRSEGQANAFVDLTRSPEKRMGSSVHRAPFAVSSPHEGGRPEASNPPTKGSAYCIWTFDPLLPRRLPAPGAAWRRCSRPAWGTPAARCRGRTFMGGGPPRASDLASRSSHHREATRTGRRHGAAHQFYFELLVASRNPG